VTDEGAIGYHTRFVEAVDDDLDMPAALTVLHEAIADEKVPPQDRWNLVASWDQVLGLDLVKSAELPPDLVALLHRRDEARAAKDFARADAIRDELRAKGIEVLDSASGTRWVRV
jgi:cysteinyl-tRNA synthetase